MLDDAQACHRTLVDPRTDLTTWDWGTNYRRRVSADRWLKAWRRDICLADEKEDAADTEWCAATLSTLSAVLDTLLTLRPFPETTPFVLTMLTPATAISPYPTGNTGSGARTGGTRERMTSAPQLPPLLIVLASGVSAFEGSQSCVRVGRMVYGPHTSRAQSNGPGREKADQTLIPTPSLPPQLVRTLLASRAVGVRGLPAYVPTLSLTHHWSDALGDVFHRIICITGFVPIPPPLVSTSTTSTTASAELEHRYDAGVTFGTQEAGEQRWEKDFFESDEHPVAQISKTFPTPLQQHADARILARRRVYDMRYLRGDRLWGPFQIVTRESVGVCPDTSGPDGNRKNKPREGRQRTSASGTSLGRGGVPRRGTLTRAVGVDIQFDRLDSTPDDSEDEDWHDPAEPEREQTIGGENTVDADVDMESELSEPEHHFFSFVLDSIGTTVTGSTSTASHRRTRRSHSRLPPNYLVSPREIRPQHLRPDYAYLASVRIVVEANLKDLFGSEISDDIGETASEVRPGEVGMFWEDEDEILRARAGPSESASSSSHVSSSPATISSSIPAASITSNIFEPTDILARFQNLEVVRLGSACGYWSGWTGRQHSAKRSFDEVADASVSSSEGNIGARKPRIVEQRTQLEKPSKGPCITEDKGKGKKKNEESTVPLVGAVLDDWEIGPEGETCEGWDWAGVAGIWRRCVCWMDYKELLFFNLDPIKFLTLDTQEACRIIPMELRITGYTRAGLMPVSDTNERDNINVLPNRLPKTGVRTRWFRPPPVIHFSGFSVGSDRGMDDGRKVTGSVQLIGGGEVRWRMDTCAHESELPGSSTPEWSSEAVQVGGIGSAVGLLGVWTGAEHESADPLGPFWAWKVA
ncbi:hypothetical protein HD554DRAFT_2128154 [Boletus coccyginus]|nr:hypothetical protein HD554DRAFT_2128154 [Boletus coccyginus]